jgi:hypothetical protein
VVTDRRTSSWGRINWDLDGDARWPLVVIDGKAFTCDQVGYMLMTFDGLPLGAQIRDTIEVIGQEPSISQR